MKKYLNKSYVSLLKLVKINNCVPQQDKPDNEKKSEVSYPFSLEIEFLLYSTFEKLRKTIPEQDDLKLIRYFSFYQDYNDQDIETVYGIIDLTESLMSDHNSQQIEARVFYTNDLIKKLKFKGKNFVDKFGFDRKFCKIYGTFLHDVLKLTQVEPQLREYTFGNLHKDSIITEHTRFDGIDPIMIVSGWHKNLGTIIYANSSFYNLLDIHLSSQLIGVNFIEFMPAPFDKMHKSVLFRFLSVRNSTELRREHLFLIDSHKFCIEVTMYFRVAFYKCYPYFIVGFKQMVPPLDLILCTTQGEIISISKRIKMLFPNISSSLAKAFPNIQDYFEKYDYEEDFKYNELGIEVFMKKYYLMIDGYEMLILYILGDTLIKSSESISKPKKKVAIQIDSVEFNAQHVENKNEALKSSLHMKQTSERIEDNGIVDRINYPANFLNLTLRICMGLEIAITLVILIIILQIINSITFNSILSDIGLLRFFSCSNLSNVRSLDLIYNNFTLAFEGSVYQSTIISNALLFEKFLNMHKDIQIPILNIQKSYFEEKIILMRSVTGNNIIANEISLYDAMKNIIQYSKIIGNLTDFSSIEFYERKMYFYMNLPTTYLDTLNDNITEIMNDFISSINSIYGLLQYLLILCLIPPIIIMCVSI